MSRDPIDFTKARELATQTHLWHGNYGAGKTTLLGDMLKHESSQGPVVFVNMRGEDGYLSIVDLKATTGDRLIIADTVNDVDDLVDNPTNPVKGLLVDAKKLGARAIGIDGWHRLYPLVYRKRLGSDRLPEVKQNSSGNEWSDVHKYANDIIDSLRRYAPIVVCTSATDRSTDQLTGKISNTPDFPGRQAAGIAGRFDFVFYLDYQVLGENKIRRTLQTAPTDRMICRARLPRPLPATIEIPANGGGWKILQAEIQKCLKAPDGR